MTVEADILVQPTAPENGVQVQVPDAAWGTGPTYGTEQAFVVLRETGEATDPGPDGSLVYRVDRYGSMGTSGGVHVATGLRGTPPDTTQAVWIDPAADVLGLVIEKAATKDYLWCVDGSEVVVKVVNGGSLVGRRDVAARDGQSTRTVIGNTYGKAGVAMGQTGDTAIWREAPGVVRVGNAALFTETASPPAPVANAAIIRSRDNGAGRTQLVAVFPSGAEKVIQEDD